MRLNILGTDYEFCMCSSKEMSDSDNLGECNRYTKTIKINDGYFLREGVEYEAEIKTIRHEIIHAIFHEAGLDCYAEDEILVDALAVLIPKIEDVVKGTQRR